MRDYELAVLLHPDLEIDLDKPLKKIDKLLKDAGADVKSSDNWGKRKLAYPIGGLNFAIYVFYRLQLAADKTAELEYNLKLADEIMRHLLVRLTDVDLKHAKESKPAPKSAAPAATKSKAED